jgi:hypothetical protein
VQTRRAKTLPETKAPQREPFSFSATGDPMPLDPDQLAPADPAWRDLPWARSAPEVAGTAAESPISPAEELAARRRAQRKANKASGAEFERNSAEKLAALKLEFAPQITVETPSRARTRLDFMARDPMTDKIMCIECKSSETAPIKPGQRRAFREILKDGATIVGKGKPGFPGGMKVSPNQVQIWRPSRQP